MASLFKRGRMYWIAYYDRGEHVQKSLKTRDKAVANYRKKTIELQLDKGESTVPNLKYILKKISAEQWVFSIWKNLNFREKQAIIFTFYEGKCFYCGKKVSIHPNGVSQKRARKDRIVLDHVIPFSAGGPDLPDNLVASCQECNLKKHDKDPNEFSRCRQSVGKYENKEKQKGTNRNNETKCFT